MKQCVYNIPCDCHRCYIGETSRPLEVCIKEHKYNQRSPWKIKISSLCIWRPQNMLERSKSLEDWTKHHIQDICTWLWYIIWSVNPIWSSLQSGLPLSQKSENYNFVRCRLYVKMCFYVGTIQRISLFSEDFYSDSTDFNNSHETVHGHRC
jgi:hypothetical protein